jgi:hypothetical protein
VKHIPVMVQTTENPVQKPMKTAPEPQVGSTHSRNQPHPHLPILLALLACAGGYSIGRHQMEWQSTLSSPPAEDRDSFCQVEWMIADFQNRFVSAHCDSMMEAFAARSRNTAHGSDAQPAASAKNQYPASSHNQAALAETIARQLEKLEQGNPAPLLLRDLLRLNKQLGREEEYQRLLSKARRNYPDNLFEPGHRALEKGNDL